jgi:23S rRNA (uracil1939-C5)-methyltransferase
VEPAVIDITTVAAGGDGLGREASGRVVFVPGALPGEQVAVVLEHHKSDFARGRLVEVLRASADRAVPPCPYVAAGCGGCDWQHIDPAAQRRLKATIVADALRRQAHLEVAVGEGPPLAEAGYRTTLRGVGVEGRFGLRQRSSHDAVAIGPCLVAHPLVDELVVDGRYPDGEVVLRAGARTGERLVIVDGDPAAARVPEGVRVVSRAELRSGRRAWFHEEVAGLRWRISADSFFQARPDGAEALVTSVRAAAEGALPPGGHLVDLYGGVGLFARTLGGSGPVTLVESSASSAADARVNLRDLDARVVRADVDHWGASGADLVVADPPRKGLGRRAVARVAATHAGRLVLVSCDPAALGRDAALLADAGFDLVSAELVDLFPHTSHVEVVSRFDRR